MKKSDLGKLTISQKTGKESFHDHNRNLDFDLKGFWQWSASDLVSNATRGILAEYIVARALGLDDRGVRNEWDAFDLETESGIKIEVKSAAYIQTWHQNRLSTITFGIPKTRAWDPATNSFDHHKKRQADLYIFGLLSHKDKITIDPLDLAQWEFYALPTKILDREKRDQKSISLAGLKKLGLKPCCFSELKQVVEGT